MYLLNKHPLSPSVSGIRSIGCWGAVDHLEETSTIWRLSLLQSIKRWIKRRRNGGRKWGGWGHDERIVMVYSTQEWVLAILRRQVGDAPQHIMEDFAQILEGNVARAREQVEGRLVPIEEAAPGTTQKILSSWMMRIKRVWVRRLKKFNRTNWWQLEGLLFQYMASCSRREQRSGGTQRSGRWNHLVTWRWRLGWGLRK